MLCRLGQLMYDTLLLASNMINPKNVTHVPTGMYGEYGTYGQGGAMKGQYDQIRLNRAIDKRGGGRERRGVRF